MNENIFIQNPFTFTLGKQFNKCDGLAPRSEYVQVIICGKRGPLFKARTIDG